MKVNASISISRIQERGVPDCVHVRVEDETSGCQFLSLELSLADFALAVTGLSGIKCKGEIYENAPIGKQRQVKEEVVECPGGLHYVPKKERSFVARQVLAAHEVDGWRGRASDLYNHHRRVRSSADRFAQRVVFIRFVDSPEEAP